MNSFQSPIAGEPSLGTMHYLSTRTDSWDFTFTSSYATYTCSSIPEGSKAVILQCESNGGIYFRPTGTTWDGYVQGRRTGTGSSGANYFERTIPVDSSKQFDAKRAVDGFASVLGYFC